MSFWIWREQRWNIGAVATTSCQARPITAMLRASLFERNTSQGVLA